MGGVGDDWLAKVIPSFTVEVVNYNQGFFRSRPRGGGVWSALPLLWEGEGGSVEWEPETGAGDSRIFGLFGAKCRTLIAQN